MSAPLTTDLTRRDVRPYFLWDDDLTVAQFEQALNGPDRERADAYLARLLREAKYEDVWRFVTPQFVADRLAAIVPRLGRSRPLWTFLIRAWRERGLVS
ncbi:MAG: hypothetical protein HYY17_09635 [Planctomycetes bacterium]|nr:hypothetical protein [Planctomycetota bacterium]